MFRPVPSCSPSELLPEEGWEAAAVLAGDDDGGRYWCMQAAKYPKSEDIGGLGRGPRGGPIGAYLAWMAILFPCGIVTKPPGAPPLGCHRRREILHTTDKWLGFNLMDGAVDIHFFVFCRASKRQVLLPSFQGLGCPAGHVWRGAIFKRLPALTGVYSNCGRSQAEVLTELLNS